MITVPIPPPPITTPRPTPPPALTPLVSSGPLSRKVMPIALHEWGGIVNRIAP